MHWKDSGYLLSKNQFNENSVIAEVFTKNHGKISGIIFGATSKKIKNYLQLGNKLHLNFNSKNDNTLGNIKVEIEEAFMFAKSSPFPEVGTMYENIYADGVSQKSGKDTNGS